MKKNDTGGRKLLPPSCLYEELDITLEVTMVVVVVVVVIVVSDGVEAVGEDPHFHGAVGAAREDVVGRPHFDLHDAGAQVPEERLASVLVGEGVERTLRGHAPNLQSGERRWKRLRWSATRSSDLASECRLVIYRK